MAERATFVRVGLLIVLGVGGIVGMVLFLTRDQVHDGLRFESYFRESVEGLNVGSPVKFRGVALGQVTDIALVNALYPDSVPDSAAKELSYELVAVRYVVDARRLGPAKDPQLEIRRGLRAKLASQGITGVAYIEIDFADPLQFPQTSVPWTPRSMVIPSMPSTIAQVQDAAQAVLAKLQAVDLVRLTGGVQAFLDELHTELATGDVHETMQTAQGLARSLQAAVDRADVPALAAELKATSAAVRGLVQGRQVRQLLVSATETTDRAAAAGRALMPLIAALQDTVRRGDTGIGDLQQQLDPLLRDARAAAANLRAASEILRQNPASLLLGAPPPPRGRAP